GGSLSQRTRIVCSFECPHTNETGLFRCAMRSDYSPTGSRITKPSTRRTPSAPNWRTQVLVSKRSYLGGGRSGLSLARSSVLNSVGRSASLTRWIFRRGVNEQRVTVARRGGAS